MLEYTSSLSLCLHKCTGEPYPDRVGGILSLSTGIPMTTLHPDASLIILDYISNRTIGIELSECG